MFVPAGTSVEVTIPVPIDELRYTDVEGGKWALEPGRYRFMVGPDSLRAERPAAEIDLP